MKLPVHDTRDYWVDSESIFDMVLVLRVEGGLRQPPESCNPTVQ